MDSNDFNNFRPVSNLPFLSKILEKLVFIQLNDYINSQNVLEKFQSGFRVNHSTETALLKILNDFRVNYDSQKVTVLVLLDLSAAFDTIDHTILLTRLKHIGLWCCSQMVYFLPHRQDFYGEFRYLLLSGP